MSFIKLNNDFPGIEGLLLNKPPIGKAICGLVNRVLRKRSSLTAGERELIAAYTSYLNQCDYCSNVHSEVTSALLKDDGTTMSCVIKNVLTAPVSDKMKSLLQIAGKVQKGGLYVTGADIKNARQHGADDNDIHDAILVSAMFCFINRYVDGLRTDRLLGKTDYQQPAKQLARFGYSYPNFIARYFMKKMVDKLKKVQATSPYEIP
jgi:uncharacterized peroxidase-related enzyme